MIDVVPVTHRARAMSLLGGSYRVGVLVGPLIGAGLIALTDLTSVFWLGAAMSVCASLLAAHHARPRRGEARRGQARPGTSACGPSSPRTAGCSRPSARAVVILGMSRSLRLSLLPLWADHVGLSASTTSLIFAGAAALDVALMWPGGWLMDTRGRMVVAVPVVLSMAIACLLLPLAGSAVSVALVMALIAAGNGLGSGIVMTLGADASPDRGPLAVPRRLAPVRRHRQHRRPAAGQRRRRGRAAGHGVPRRGRARPGGRRVGGLLDRPRRPRPAYARGRADRPALADGDGDLVGDRPGCRCRRRGTGWARPGRSGRRSRRCRRVTDMVTGKSDHAPSSKRCTCRIAPSPAW